MFKYNYGNVTKIYFKKYIYAYKYYKNTKLYHF